MIPNIIAQGCPLLTFPQCYLTCRNRILHEEITDYVFAVISFQWSAGMYVLLQKNVQFPSALTLGGLVYIVVFGGKRGYNHNVERRIQLPGKA